jgi:glycosyltransferase involved in cell wall biosynthesis
MRTLLLVTDNRFWLNRLGSNARILSMVQHLQRRGWAVQVAFLGHAYPIDPPLWRQLELQVAHSLPALPMPAVADAGALAAAAPAAPALRQRARALRRWLRAARTQRERPPPPWGWWREVALRAQAPQVQDGADPRHAALVQRLCAEHPPAVVLVEYVRLAWVAPLLPAAALRVIDTHDVQHERQQRFHLAGEPHGLDIGPQEEARWLGGFDVAVAIQRRDAQTLQALLQGYPRTRVITAMHPMPLRAPVPAPAGPPCVCFVGSGMAPNVRAARELAQDIWPLLLARWPADRARPRLLLVGAAADPLRGQRLAEGVELLGHADDLGPLYARVAVVVNPVRLGGGLKIKNVDALCAGKALVTTTLGAEGLEDGAGSAYVVADEPEAFAAAVLALLCDDAARDGLAAQAYRYACTQFAADTVYAELDAELDAEHEAELEAPVQAVVDAAAKAGVASELPAGSG